LLGKLWQEIKFIWNTSMNTTL